ncbi:hypothetical protein [Sphingomonas alba]|uniref:Uncharacterized protein n=1 Tax=Sphingomonas alba TaxID=2908208 RepID=A0ABT0RPX5_9SPHN|nr:hypothetical protein [Sphingomonas alba]MCL6684517.1 hypothetical protein [Sphingomonas alba]
MTKRAIFLVVGLGLMATAAPAQLVTDPLGGADTSADDTQLKSLVDSCPGHKFETTVITGPGRGSKVKICGEAGQSDTDWLVTLQDSIQKTEADEEMAPRVKSQIITALKNEIAKLETTAGSNPTGGTVKEAPAEYALNLPAERVAPSERPPEYSSLPPLPAPKRSTPLKLANGTVLPATPAPEPVARPNLVVRCAVPHETFATCSRLERESQVLVRAEEDMPAGTSLRFLRGDDNRAELDLSQLKKGDTLKERLPSRVCSGVMRGKVRVQVMNKGQVAETLGPWALYCAS